MHPGLPTATDSRARAGVSMPAWFWRGALLALGLPLLLCGCPGERTNRPGDRRENAALPEVHAATIAYIGNFRGFQRPCGCDQRQDGGLLRLATVLRVLRGELAAEDAMLKDGAMPAHGAATGDGGDLVEAVADVPGMEQDGSNPEPESGSDADPDTQTADKPADGSAAEAEASPTPEGAAPLDPALPVKAPAEAALDPLWLVECGNFVDEANRLPGFRAASHLKALELLGAKAAVLGRSETRLSAEQARLAFKDSPLPLLSCNLSSSLKEVKVQPSLELARGWYLIGLTEPEGSDSAGFASGGLALRRKLGGHTDSDAGEAWASVSDPVSAVQAEIAELPKGSSIIIACAQIPDGLMAQLQPLGARVIIGAPHAADFQPRVEKMELPAAVDAPVRRGLLASFVSLQARGTQPGANSALFWSYRLATGIVDDPAMDELLKSQEQESMKVALNSDEWKNTNWGQDESYLPPEMRKKGSIVPGYVGSTTCKDCHPGQHKVWESSGHSHAFETLIQHDNGGTLDCLECHVVGLLEPGGFLPASAQTALAAVGCESCHGPGGEHVGLAQRLDQKLLSADAIKAGKLPVMEKKAISRGDFANCVYCHDDFNSPDFQLQTYWPQIEH